MSINYRPNLARPPVSAIIILIGFLQGLNGARLMNASVIPSPQSSRPSADSIVGDMNGTLVTRSHGVDITYGWLSQGLVVTGVNCHKGSRWRQHMGLSLQ